MKIRLGHIDSMRGLAAIAVVIFHSILSLGDSYKEVSFISSFFKEYFDLGKIAVIIFFFISGLVIPFSLKGINKKTSIKKFIISRLFRLYPVYWLSALLGFFIYKTFTYQELLVNLTMIQQFIGFDNIIGLYWTLQIELIFYALIAGVFLVGKLENRKFLFISSILFLVLSLGMAIIRGHYAIKLPLAVPLALSIMFFGAFIRSYLIDKKKENLKYSYSYFIIYLLIIPVISKLGYDLDLGYNESWIKYTITYYTGLLIMFFLIRNNLSSTVTEYLGKISYSVYLFHPLVITVYLRYFNIKLNGFLALILILTLSIALSHLTYMLIEEPSIKLGRTLKTKLFPKYKN